MENKDLKKRTKDVRIPRLIAELNSNLDSLKAILVEKQEKLDSMTISEWGMPEGQKLEGQANNLVHAEIWLDTCIKWLFKAEEFNE